MKEVKLYTDGACSGNPGKGGYGAILIYNNVEKEISGGEDNTTNNKMEIMAVLCKVTVYSDSAYVVNAIDKGWVYSWKRNNWKKADKKEVKNIDLWEEMLKLLELHEVKFIKVKGHSDNEYNNRCDELARMERDKASNSFR